MSITPYAPTSVTSAVIMLVVELQSSITVTKDEYTTSLFSTLTWKRTVGLSLSNMLVEVSPI